MESPGAATDLRVSADGLRAAAGWCGSLAGRLARTSAPPAVASHVLASSAAVHAAHAQIAAAGLRCSSRVEATAGKLVAASAGYRQNEDAASAEFRALRPVRA
jgi:hypothetical protein